MVDLNSAIPTPEPYNTVARPVAKLTCASSTPPSFPRARWILLEHAAQVMPSMVRSVRDVGLGCPAGLSTASILMCPP